MKMDAKEYISLYKMYADESDRQFEEILEKINGVMDSYIILAKEKYREVENVFEDMCFFTDIRKKKYHQICEKIHVPMREILNTVQKESSQIEK